MPAVPALRRALGGLAIAAALLLAGCKSDLYTNLTEFEANQMLAVLMANGLSAEKEGVGEAFTLSVEKDDMQRAIELLNEKGFPRNTRESMGKVFQKSGIISSPFEERVRYIYALGEEVAQTISQIDGVVTARVHIVLPEEPQLGQPVRPSSAAVFIKHEPNVDLEFLVPQIRRLVSSSIEGLDYASVTVVLTEAMPSKVPTAAGAASDMVEVLPGLSVARGDVGRFWNIAYAAAGIVAVLVMALAGTVAMAVTRGRKRAKARTAEPGTALMEPS
ncbi:type III secretion system inner membrane ring lipoprotein SctJ [Aureimonas leprariae]|uniref:type III secretion system inner membrane ring lipoprotein SctJ n=1 Tax=Plantimonas leprariae TaxID=2615207 RepID=UPI001386A507|nr:type III secretion inner membrane ring lipoprotein SctJ [Aureimonas leprariae]